MARFPWAWREAIRAGVHAGAFHQLVELPQHSLLELVHAGLGDAEALAGLFPGEVVVVAGNVEGADAVRSVGEVVADGKVT
jgi:hypothetical protein